MTPKKFLAFFFLQWLLLALLKAWFFKYEIFANAGLQQVAFWLATAAVVAAIVRRFGTITFFEAFFVVFVWSLGNLLLDLLLLSPSTGLSIFSSTQYWWSFAVLIAAIMLFHKKHHIKIRHEQAAHIFRRH